MPGAHSSAAWSCELHSGVDGDHAKVGDLLAVAKIHFETDLGAATDGGSGGNGALVAALLIKYYGTDQDPRLTEPLHTIPTKDRFGLVTVTIHGTAYYISDIGMRMLAPHELYAAQGFPPDYQIDRGADGRPMTKTAQVRMVGNSVCPPVARAVVLANYSQAMAIEEQAA